MAKESVAETLILGLSQPPYLEVARVDSVFRTEIGPEELKGHE